MPNNKRDDVERNAHPNPSERDRKGTPSAGADKSRESVGKQSTKAHDKGAVTEEVGDRGSSRGR